MKRANLVATFERAYAPLMDVVKAGNDYGKLTGEELDAILKDAGWPDDHRERMLFGFRAVTGE